MTKIKYIKEGKLCRFDYAASVMHERRNSKHPDQLDHDVLVFDIGLSWGRYPLDTVFVLLGCEKLDTWKVLTPIGEVGNVYKSSYAILEIDRDHK